MLTWQNDRITCITGTDRLGSFKCFDEFANTADARDITELLERTGLLTVDGLTSCLTLLTLQTLSPVVLLEQTV